VLSILPYMVTSYANLLYNITLDDLRGLSGAVQYMDEHKKLEVACQKTSTSLD